ncbi:hypothetical protein O6H91_23G026600 [Diphasiastrum complanatum]|uniref:Uncharacterized protein n=1 Tax=Diphasiastrum complanatum TaxID=34168 RepID=A0ACC2A970_DIPCM|nr:hypothetical protein O6H91_23G026600 [Diphasiastrum complanatum]
MNTLKVRIMVFLIVLGMAVVQGAVPIGQDTAYEGRLLHSIGSCQTCRVAGLKCNLDQHGTFSGCGGPLPSH